MRRRRPYAYRTSHVHGRTWRQYRHAANTIPHAPLIERTTRAWTD